MTRLILFDVDGTLLTARGAPRRAFAKAMIEVYGTAGPVDSHPFDGKTDPQIARELLEAEGLGAGRIDEGLPRLWSIYLRELRLELSRQKHRTVVMPGVLVLLERLERANGSALIGLLTGNIREGAALKLESAGIRTAFRVGAFGSDCERRDGLPPVAAERARELTGRDFRGADIVIVGDTPSDVTCGRALAVRAIGVATGRHGPDDLRNAGAHAVFTDLTDTEAVLEALLG